MLSFERVVFTACPVTFLLFGKAFFSRTFASLSSLLDFLCAFVSVLLFTELAYLSVRLLFLDVPVKTAFAPPSVVCTFDSPSD